jgi:hypothetical protein
MGKIGVLSAALLAGCGGGSAASGDPPADSIEAAAPAREAGAIGDGDAAAAESAPDGAVRAEGDASADGPWLPLVRPDGAALAQRAQTACASWFAGLPSDCGARSPLSRAAMTYVDLCAYAHQHATDYCEGVTDETVGSTCVVGPSGCYQGRPTTTVTDALCIFRCYDAAICGSASSDALAKCDASSSGDPIGCLISGSCYPSFDPTPW